MTENTKADTLFIVHVEDLFYPRWIKDSFLDALVEHLEKEKYRCVVSLTSFIEDFEPILCIKRFCDEDIEWAWGYEHEMFNLDDEDNEEERWIIPASGHEWTWVPPELRNGRDFGRCHVVGGCRSECLADWLDVLEFVGIEYDVLEELTY